jgi:superfamily II DNA or RNA helicase
MPAAVAAAAAVLSAPETFAPVASATAATAPAVSILIPSAGIATRIAPTSAVSASAPARSPSSDALKPVEKSDKVEKADKEKSSDKQKAAPAADPWVQFQNTAQPARSAADYEMHLAAHEMDMGQTLSLNNFDEFLCKPKINVQPFRHQIEAAITYFRHLAPRGLVADDVGLGKTVIAGLIVSELMARGRVKSLLIVCPRPLMDQWKGELINKFGIAAEAAPGAEFDRVRNAPVVITTYQTAASRIDFLIQRGFDMVMMDEAHKLRSLSGPGPGSTMAQAFQKFMANRGAKFVLMLTATPLQNKLWDIHSLMEILCAPQPNPLGTQEEFAARFIADGKGNARKLSEEAQDDFRRRVSQFISRRRRVDAGLLFPKRLVLDRKECPTLDEQVYLNDCLDFLGKLQLPPMEQCTFARSVLSSPAAAAGSLKKMKFNMPGDFHAQADELIARGEQAAEKPTTKGLALVELIRNLQREDPNWRAIVFTQRRATLRSIQKTLKEHGLDGEVCTFQGGDADTNRQSIADFTADPPRKRIFVATDAGAEGLNLQMCSVLINYDLPWNPMCVEQRIGRVQRLGQKASHVVINNLVLRDTLEEKVVLRLWEKLDLFKAAVGEMEEVLSLAGETETESFEQDILKMIKKSLTKADADKDIELKKRSLEDARSKFGEMRAATEEALGRLDPEDDAPAPKLDRRDPRKAPTDFALAALEKRSRKLVREGDRLTATVGRGAGETLVYTLNPNDPGLPFNGGPVTPPGGAPAVRLLAPGTRDFTELVDEWKARDHVFAVNSIGRTRPVDSVVNAWLAERGEPAARSVKVVRRGMRMCAELTAYVRAAVHHDRYESLVETPLRYPEDGVGFEMEAGLPVANVPLAALGEGWWKHAKSAVMRDAEADDAAVMRFCKFYEGRRREHQARLLRQVADRMNLGVTEHTTTERVLEKLAPRFGVDLIGDTATDVEEICRRLDEYKPAYKAAVADIDIKNKPSVEVRPVGLRAILYERMTAAVEMPDGSTRSLEVVPLSGRVFPTGA